MIHSIEKVKLKQMEKGVDGLKRIKRNKKVYCNIFDRSYFGEILYEDRNGMIYIMESHHPEVINLKN